MTLCKIFAKPEIELKLLNELEQKEQFSRFGIFVSDFLKHMIRLKKVSKQKHNLENLRLMIKSCNIKMMKRASGILCDAIFHNYAITQLVDMFFEFVGFE